ncbi:MAG: hypothetical protein ACFCUM_09890 [Bacteroidales bacterium]
MFKIKLLFLTLLAFSITLTLKAWSEHPLLARLALSELDLWEKVDSVEVKSLKQFLIETEEPLAVFLAEHEIWARSNLKDYLLRPDDLIFSPGLDQDGIVERFFHAIRINPHSRVALYLYVNPHQHPGDKLSASYNDISTLERPAGKRNKVYVWIREGELVHPLDVVTSANNEPDYGIDLGLFEDNMTVYGKQFGFGKQPFGNPNLDYSSQAPFHMSFYHEAKILYRFAPSLKHTFLEYRVNQFRDLAIFAFEHDQPYWGWRFLGWSMHYATDATMPYHSKPLPGYSMMRLMWINLKAALGFRQARSNAIQLVSNKHTVIETYQEQELRRVYRNQVIDHPFIIALRRDTEKIAFTESFIREVVSKKSVDDAKLFDKKIKQYFPPNMVKDPSVEVINLPELSDLRGQLNKKMGDEATEALNDLIARRFVDFGMTIRTILFSVVEESSS